MTTPETPSSTPWYRQVKPKFWIIAAAVFAVLMISIISAGIAGERADAAKSGNTTSTAPATGEAPAYTAVPDVAGLAADEAKKKLKEAGFAVKFDEDHGTVILASNWKVLGQTPTAGESAQRGTTVVLKVSKASASDAAPSTPATVPTSAPEPVPVADKTSTGLSGTYAQAACELEIAASFPYGAKPHWFTGKLAERIENDQWFFKVNTTVTNAFKAKRDYDVECYVGGTNDAPVVTEFNAY